MTMILDVPSGLPSPQSMVLFDDTAGAVVYYAPKEWRLRVINGQPAISYYENKDADVAFVQMEFEPWFETNDLTDLRKLAQSLHKNVEPVRYLGKNEQGTSQSSIVVLISFPDDPRFRFQVAGGKGGFLGNPIPIVLSMNYLTGQIVRDVIQSKNIGMVLQFGAVVRGATTSFEADIDIDYDRTYEMLSTHVSWNWWIWSGDVQAAWQTLTTTGAITVNILGGTADQKTMIYKTMEFMRDLFFKPEVSGITAPAHPTGGIINTSLRYEKIHEHKHFHLTLRERDFTEAPFNSACMTGKQSLSSRIMRNDPMLEQLFEMAVAPGAVARAETFSLSMLEGIGRYNTVLGQLAAKGKQQNSES
jgi:hypothetical protein